jgi:hypothetical protein
MPRSKTRSDTSSEVSVTQANFYSEEEEKISLRNQFNYQERATQTVNFPLKSRGLKTRPPEVSEFEREMT